MAQKVLAMMAQKVLAMMAQKVLAMMAEKVLAMMAEMAEVMLGMAEVMYFARNLLPLYLLLRCRPALSFWRAAARYALAVANVHHFLLWFALQRV